MFTYAELCKEVQSYLKHSELERDAVAWILLRRWYSAMSAPEKPDNAVLEANLLHTAALLEADERAAGHRMEEVIRSTPMTEAVDDPHQVDIEDIF